MNSLRLIKRKIDAILLIIIAVLALTLVLSWNYYQSRKISKFDKEELAAQYLAYGLPQEAVRIIEEIIAQRPLATKSISMRIALADIYMEELKNYEKALANLLFVASYSPSHAPSISDKINRCLARLGRVYDIERRAMLDKGIKPTTSDISEKTIVQVGNKALISVEEALQRVTAMGIVISQLNPEQFEAIIKNFAHEKLLQRAAKRENYDKNPDFIEKVRQFELNLALNEYLENNLFADLKVEEHEVKAYLEKNKDNLKDATQNFDEKQIFSLAHQKLLNEKQNILLAEKLSELSKLEELKINSQHIIKELFPDYKKNTDKEN